MIVSPEDTYQQRAAAASSRRDYFARQSARAANLNVVLFVAALGCLGLGLWQAQPLLLGLAAILGLGFVASYVRHGRIDRRQEQYQRLLTLANEGLARLQRNWDGLPLRYPQNADPVHLYAADLDLFGHASLLHLLGSSATPAGRQTLADWLLAPAAPETIRGRQAAVAELAPHIDLREELALRGQQVGSAQTDFLRFRRWAEQQPWLSRRPWLVALSRLLPLLSLALLAAQGLGWVTLPLALLPLGIAALLTFTICREADQIIDGVAERQTTFRAYAELFALIEAQPFAATELRSIQQRLTAAGLRADQQLRRLGRLMPLADLRGWMFFLPIQILTLWNLNLLWLLERWRTRAGAHVGLWLDALGDQEALAALATLHFDHPNWSFPVVDRGAALLQAIDLGHPLLPDTARVGNPVRLGPSGNFLLITGSNMAGKSTLLRAIGLNIVLAQAGAPACARQLELPPVALLTSMRVQDSLAQGVSYYFAELQRLKAVVDRAGATRITGEQVPLFLLDEILQGTNTAERQIAARRIIIHLLRLGAMGAVSTHDLTLADSPDLAAASQRFYLTEQVVAGPDGPQMRFDYLLRPGIAPSTNALRLLELVGLPGADSEIAG